MFENNPKYPSGVADPEELLDFVNKARAAGGADVLEALLPSMPGDESACLIANGLNFGCTVNGHSSVNSDEPQWAMYFPDNLDSSQARDIADALGCEYDRRRHCIVLPQRIGNAAQAFDNGDAYRDYADEESTLWTS
jgi:hypothetical protein